MASQGPGRGRARSHPGAQTSLLGCDAAQQIFFWALAGVATWGLVAVITGTVFVLHRHPVEYGPSMSAITVLCLALSVSMWWAFFPPLFLRRHAIAQAG